MPISMENMITNVSTDIGRNVNPIKCLYNG